MRVLGMVVAEMMIVLFAGISKPMFLLLGLVALVKRVLRPIVLLLSILLLLRGDFDLARRIILILFTLFKRTLHIFIILLLLSVLVLFRTDHPSPCIAFIFLLTNYINYKLYNYRISHKQIFGQPSAWQRLLS